MKKVLATVVTIVAFGTTAWFMQPEQPVKYQLHVVTYGETMEGIIRDANQNSDVSYDIRDAVSIAVNESSKMEGGATSRSIYPGEKIAVPIYK